MFCFLVFSAGTSRGASAHTLDLSMPGDDSSIEPLLTPRTRRTKMADMTKEEMKAHLLAESRKRVLAGISRRKSLGDEMPAPRPPSPEPRTPNRKSVEGQIERAMKRRASRSDLSSISPTGTAAEPTENSVSPPPQVPTKELLGAFERLDVHQVDSVPRKHLADALEKITGARTVVSELEALQVTDFDPTLRKLCVHTS